MVAKSVRAAKVFGPNTFAAQIDFAIVLPDTLLGSFFGPPPQPALQDDPRTDFRAKFGRKSTEHQPNKRIGARRPRRSPCRCTEGPSYPIETNKAQDLRPDRRRYLSWGAFIYTTTTYVGAILRPMNGTAWCIINFAPHRGGKTHPPSRVDDRPNNLTNISGCVNICSPSPAHIGGSPGVPRCT